jgi:lambda family phage minor tail protein L
MTIQQQLIKSDIPAFVDLYKLDGTDIGITAPFYFTAATDGVSTVSFGGQVYTPIPIDASGFTSTSDGSLPRPKLTVSNVNKFIQPFIFQYNFLAGARVTRTRTLDIYLDGRPTADSTQKMPDQVWYIDQIEGMTKSVITFSLVSPMDRPGVMLPKRQILRDHGFPGAGFPYLT